MQPPQQQPQYKILCSKNDVILKRELQNNNASSPGPGPGPASNTFVIDFEINNSRIDLERFCNFNIFKLMFELNREDAIQDLRITDCGDSNSKSNNVKDMLLVFKRKMDDMGIKQKYMNLQLTLTATAASSAPASSFVFESVDADLDTGTGGTDLSRAERVCDTNAVLCMSLLNRNRLRIQFVFSVPAAPAGKPQPSYIENNLGVIMKKILSRVKTFIEQM